MALYVGIDLHANNYVVVVLTAGSGNPGGLSPNGNPASESTGSRRH